MPPITADERRGTAQDRSAHRLGGWLGLFVGRLVPQKNLDALSCAGYAGSGATALDRARRRRAIARTMEQLAWTPGDGGPDFLGVRSDTPG